MSLSAIGLAQTWSSHENISSPYTFLDGTTSPQLEMDKEGNVFAVWTSLELLGCEIIASRFDIETKKWSVPQKIGFNYSQDPRLAVTQGGKAIVVWKKVSEGKGIIYYNTYQEAWGVEKPIDLSEYFCEDHPGVGVDERGNAIIVWQSQAIEPGSRGSVIRSTTYNFLTDFLSPIVDLSTNYTACENYYVGQPEIAVNPAGKAVAVWRYDDGGSTESPFRIQSNTYMLGSWGQEEDVSVSSSVQLVLPIIAISQAGESIAIWLQTHLNYYVVTTATKMDKWGSLTALSSTGYLKGGINPEKGPYLARVAIDNQGFAIAGWTLINEDESNLPLHKVQVRTFQNSKWGCLNTLSDYSTISGLVKIAFDGLGNAWALFVFQGFSFVEDEMPISILASKFNKKLNAWSLPLKFSINDEKNTAPNIAANDRGNFFAVWVANNNNFDVLQSSNFIAEAPVSLPPPPPPLLPLPPIKLEGHQIRNLFVTQIQIVNIISWEAPQGGAPPTHYLIYRDASLKEIAGSIPANGRLEFIDRNRKNRKSYAYYIVSIDCENRKSDAIKIIVNPT